MSFEKNSPLYSLTVGEYVELQKSILKDLPLLSAKKEEKELLSIQEAAEFLQLSVPTLYTMNCKKQIPFTKVSGKVYYRRSALISWLDSGERKTKAQFYSKVEEVK